MRVVLALGLCGCSSIFGLKSPRAAADAAAGDATDAPTDIAIDGTPADAQLCFGSGDYTVCFDTLPTTAQDLAGSFITTTTANCSTGVHWMDLNQPAACFVAGTTVTVGPLVATGTLPLVIVATDTITFRGLVDLSSHRDAARGAGAGTADCGAPGAAQQNTEGGAGGAGGSFATVGGKGGTGANGALAGTPAAIVAGDVLGGGCAGGAGARGGGGSPGSPGAGGGALYAVAGSAIMLGTATLAADGAGATLSDNRWGGGGGGTGGMLVLDAPSFTATAATLVANGGGGASGTGGGAGVAGQDPNPMTPTTPATGGAGGSTNADGGAGFALGAVAHDGSPTTGGAESGGGGGGGGGYIRTNIAITGVTASPAVVVMP